MMILPPTSEKAVFWRASDLEDLELLKANFITHTYPRHTHEGYVVGVIERGTEAFYYRRAMHAAPAGSIVVINPGEVHTGQAGEDAGWSYRTLYPNLDLIKRVMVEMGNQPDKLPFFPKPVIEDRQLAGQLHQLHLILENSAAALERESAFISVLAHLVGRHADHRTALPRLGNERQAIKRVQDYLQTNYAQNVSLSHVADLVNLSPYHLARIFRKEVGLPPHAYLTQVRIVQAKKLLARGQPIVEVAAETGFVDQSHLTRHFKRFVGVTPGQYREGG